MYGFKIGTRLLGGNAFEIAITFPAEEARAPCPSCGSNDGRVQHVLASTVTPHSMLAMTAKDSSGRWFVKQKIGESYFRLDCAMLADYASRTVAWRTSKADRATRLPFTGRYQMARQGSSPAVVLHCTDRPSPDGVRRPLDSAHHGVPTAPKSRRPNVRRGCGGRRDSRRSGCRTSRSSYPWRGSVCLGPASTSFIYSLRGSTRTRFSFG
jgi:hypothetical protein